MHDAPTSARTGAVVETRPFPPVDRRARRLVDALGRLQRSLHPAESNDLDSIETLERDT